MARMLCHRDLDRCDANILVYPYGREQGQRPVPHLPEGTNGSIGKQ